jgi:hypothetical protein
MITPRERTVLKYLQAAYNEFAKLPTQHPSERAGFVDGIHKCQLHIGMRVARRAIPDIFPVIKMKRR